MTKTIQTKPETIEALAQAVRALASVCDGAREEDFVGFNASDTAWGKALSCAPINAWDDEIAGDAYVTLRKYVVQLAAYGINFDEIEKPAILGHTSGRKKLNWVDVAGGSICFRFGYDPIKSGRLKEIVYGVRWNGDDRVWMLHPDRFHTDSLYQVKAFANQFDFHVHSEVAELIERRLADKHLSDATLVSEIVAAPAGPVLPPLPTYRVEVSSTQSDLLVVTNPYNAAITAAIKSVTGRRWDGVERCWNVPARCAADLHDALSAWDFSWDDAALLAVKAQTDREAAAVVRAEASRAEDAEIEIVGLNGTLRPFQRAGAKYAVETERCFIADDMGLGKTIQALAAVHAADAYPCVIICPASVKLNWRKEILKWLPGKTVSVLNGGTPDYSADFVILNYDITGKHLEPLLQVGFKAMVVDESHYCFPAGTLVDTDRGLLPIERIVQERIPARVLSFNTNTVAVEYQNITDWFVFDQYASLVKVRHEHGEFVCTADHHIWTDCGYREAGSLVNGEVLLTVQRSVYNAQEGQGDRSVLQSLLRFDSSERPSRNQKGYQPAGDKAVGRSGLRMVRGGVQCQSEQPETLLQPFMCGQVAHEPAAPQRAGSTIAENRSAVQQGTETPRRFRAHEAQQPYQRPGSTCQNYREQIGLYLPFQGWQRGTDGAAEEVSCCAQPTDGICHRNCPGQGPVPVAASLLQSRHSRPGAQISYRSGREDASPEKMAISGCAQDQRIERSKVVSVEVYQRTSDDRSRSSGQGDTRVYCLGVAHNHNFFADGVLVSNCKSADAQRTKNVEMLATGIKKIKPKGGRTQSFVVGQPIRYRFLLTGTPVLNRPKELISQLSILERLNDMGGFWNFANRYCQAYRTAFGIDMDGADNLVELNELLRSTCYVRREKSQVLTELPPKQRIEVPVTITNKAEYQKAVKNFLAWLRTQKEADQGLEDTLDMMDPETREKAMEVQRAVERARRAEMLVKINYLKQLASAGKMEAVKEWVEDFLVSGQKLVLFAWHRDTVKLFSDTFKAPHIMGGDSAEARQAAVERFQTDPTCNLIVCNIIAAGEGITLTASSTTMFVELGWNPGKMEQAEDRVHRIGQTADSVNAYYLLGEGTIDEDIYALIEAKRKVTDAANKGEVSEEEDQGILEALIERMGAN